MLKTITWNINRKNRDLALFEIGKIYRRTEGGEAFQEEPAVCIGLTGALRKDWEEGERACNIFDLKGIVNTVLRRVHLEPVYVPVETGLFRASMAISLRGDKEPIGIGGEIDQKVLGEYDIDRPVFILQLTLGNILSKGRLENRYQPVPRFPFSSRDVSVLCDRTVFAADILDSIKLNGEDMVREVELIDAYRGENIPEGTVSYTYTIKYGSLTRTLTDDEIEVVHERIKENIQKTYNVTFR